MRKVLLWLLVVSASLLVGGYLLLMLTAPKHRINRNGFAKIRLGMTEEEVQEILRVPSGDYVTGRGEMGEIVSFGSSKEGDAETEWKQWSSNEGTSRSFSITMGK